MNRRTFISTVLPGAFAGVVLAKDKGAAKSGRLSGRVTSVDKNSMTIEMRPNSAPNSSRKIMYDTNTKFTTDRKASSADDVKEGIRIVAVGNYDGVNLKATRVALYNK